MNRLLTHYTSVTFSSVLPKDRKASRKECRCSRFWANSSSMVFTLEVLAIGVKKYQTAILLDDESSFSATPPTTFWPLANLWYQSLR